MRPHVLSMVALALLSTEAQAKSAFCVFDKSVQSTVASNTKDVTIYKRGPQKLELRYTNINTGVGVAQLVGDQGVTTVMYSPGRDTISFTDLAPLGGSTVTTIFRVKGSDRFPAVHSRHIAMSDVGGDDIGGDDIVATFSQWSGTCQLSEFEGRWGSSAR